MSAGSFFSELKRRNVLRAGVLYVGGVWALAQGISQLGPSFGAPDWLVRWFVIAAAIGFPFWLAFAWFYEWTPDGFKLERDIAPDESITPRTGRKLDFAVVAVLVLSVVLLLTDRLVPRRDAGAPAVAASASVVPAAASAPVAAPGVSVPDKSIAVLPLANAGGDAGQQYFSDGLSENLIIALSKFAGLKVIGRNSSFQFRDTKDDARAIGARLGVAHLLEGSVQHAGDVVRVSAELINTVDNSTLWSERYDRPYKDLFALQDEITQAVADALKARLLPGASVAAQSDRPPSGNLDAYNAYLQGKFYMDRGSEADIRKAIEQFETATRLDPRYALAFAELSRAWRSLAEQSLDPTRPDGQQAYAQARKAVDTALALAPDLAIAHVQRGALLKSADLDWKGADAEFQHAAQLAPDDSGVQSGLADVHATAGRLQLALESKRKALAVDPLNARSHYWSSVYLGALGRLDEAEAAVRKAIELQPTAALYHGQLAIIEIQRGDAAAALAAARQEPPGIWQRIALALATQIGTDRAAADAALQTLVDEDASSGAYQIAETYALRRDADKTFEWLDRAWTDRDPGITYLLYDLFIPRFKDDPRFAAYCAKVGLPATTDVGALP